MPEDITAIIFGTYEGGAVGFEVFRDDKGSFELNQIMSTPCHVGCVRVASASGRYAVTGGTDELINVFDLTKKRHLGTMGGSVHTSTITALGVCSAGGLLVSGCDEGHIAITRLKDSETLKSFKGHKSAVLDISCHPSGRVALSISTDNTLRMWDLARGTCAAVRTVCPVKRPNSLRGAVSAANMQVEYTPQGSRYALLLPGGRIEICSSSSTEVVALESSSVCICPLTEDHFLTGDNRGNLQVITLFGGEAKIVAELPEMHSTRTKGIARVLHQEGDSAFAASVCAAGRIVFTKYTVSENKFEVVRTVETGSRVTCFSSNC
jgi:protein MAK11